MSIFNSWIVFHSHLLQYNLLSICLCPDVMMIHHSIVDLKIRLLHLHHFQLMIVDESRRKDGSRRKCWIVERSSICCEVGTSGVVSSGFPKAIRFVHLCGGEVHIWGMARGGRGQNEAWVAGAECNRSEIYVNCPLRCKTPLQIVRLSVFASFVY